MMARRTVEHRGSLKGKILAWLVIGIVIYWAYREPASAAAVVRALGEWIIHSVQGIAQRTKTHS
jgi:hypothetical protein